MEKKAKATQKKTTVVVKAAAVVKPTGKSFSAEEAGLAIVPWMPMTIDTKLADTDGKVDVV